jgi:hypothetical protein
MTLVSPPWAVVWPLSARRSLPNSCCLWEFLSSVLALLRDYNVSRWEGPSGDTQLTSFVSWGN